MYTALTGGVGAVGGALLNDDDHKSGALTGALPGAAMVLGGLAGRGLSSQALSKLYQARIPAAIAPTIRDFASYAPVAAAREEQLKAPDNGYADGGEVKKSTFWDLVKQAYKEATSTGNDAQPTQQPTTSPDPGSQASGSVGADFDNKIAQGVAANGG
jgi:hypothetical protein